MSSVRYFNQSAPIWDFIANLEEHGSNHPFFAAFNPPQGRGHEANSPWEYGNMGCGFGCGSQGRRGGRGPHRRGDSHERRGMSPGHHGPHPHHDGPSPPGPAPPHGLPHHEHGPSHGGFPHDHAGPSHDHREGPPPPPPQDNQHAHPRSPSPHHREKGRSHGSCRRGHHYGGPPGAGRRDRGGFPGFGNGGPFNFSELAEFFQSQILGNKEKAHETQSTKAGDASSDFEPLVDVFDTEAAFVVHVSLAGANKDKDDVAVHWDHEKSELNISGVLYRPGEEEFLQTLALDERQQGAFSRKIRLGSRAHPAQVDADGITAKLEDGVLRINVPKEDKDYVEVKVVDIQ